MANISFRRIRGRIVPISGDAAKKLYQKGTLPIAAAKAGAGAIGSTIKKQPIKANEPLRALGFGAAIADGIFSGATLFSGIGGTKGFIAGQGISLGLSAGSTAANIASYAGKGNLKGRGKAIARQEAINTVVGNAAFGATLLALPSSRRKIFEGAAKAVGFFKNKIGVFL